MCGRYEFSDEKDIEEIHKILAEINAKHNGATCKTGEIFPTNHVPVLALAEGKPTLSVMEWGFPRWDGKGVIINAKSETATEKSMFSKSLFERRCVIPSTGFYEWQKKEASNAKDKFLFNTKDSAMLYMAGLYNIFKDGDLFRESFVILTRAANASISDVHDRMPVILYKNELKNWLLDEKFIEEAFRRDSVTLKKEAV